MATSEDKYAVERLDVDNFSTWSIRMQAYLMVKGLWDAVTTDTPDPTANKKALAHIILHVKDHHLATLAPCTSAKTAWQTLKATYDAQTNARKLLLRREMTQLKMGAAEPLTVYAARAKNIQTQLTTAGDTASDEAIALQFVAGLPPAYEMIGTVLTTGDQALKIDTILPKLMHVEQQMKPDEHPREAALMGKRGYSSRSGLSNTGERICYYCGEPGHIKADCPKRKRNQERNGSYGARYLNAIAL